MKVEHYIDDPCIDLYHVLGVMNRSEVNELPRSEVERMVQGAKVLRYDG